MAEKNESSEILIQECSGTELSDKLLELTKDNQREYVTVGNCSIAFTYAEEEHADYINRVFASSRFEALESNEDAFATIDTIHDPKGLIRHHLQPLISELIDIYGQQRSGVIITPNWEIYNANSYLVAIDRRDPETHVYNVGSKTHFALSSLMRKILITSYCLDNPNLVPFHAATIVNRSGEAVVLSSYGGLGGGNRGKTTTALASVVRSNSEFSLLSNDEVLFSLTEGNSLQYHHLPSEINIKEGTLRGIQDAGVELSLEEYRDINQKGNSYHLTEGGIEISGFSVANNLSGVRIWANVDIRPGCDDYEIVDIDETTQLALFIEAINRGRLYHFDLPDVCGELLAPREYLTEENSVEIVEKAKLIYHKLKDLGVRFVTIKGGVDREKLYQLTKQLL